MTVPATTNRVSYAGNGVTTAFAFPHFLIQKSDMLVYGYNTATRAITLYTLVTDYVINTVAAANGTFPSGVTVTMNVAPAAGITLILVRAPDFLQAVHWVDADPDPSAVKELAFDKLTLEVQRLKDLLSRSAKLLDGDATTFDPTLPTNLAANPLAGLIVNLAGTGWDVAVPNAASMNPYTPPSGGFATGITVQTALDALNSRIHGSRAAPILITGAGFTADTGVLEQIWYVKGSGGPVDLSAVNPPMSAGTLVGQCAELHGCDDTNTVTVANNAGFAINGTRVLRNGTVLGIRWDGALWCERFFNNL
jgi:hypothetical protein